MKGLALALEHCETPWVCSRLVPIGVKLNCVRRVLGLGGTDPTVWPPTKLRVSAPSREGWKLTLRRIPPTPTPSCSSMSPSPPIGRVVPPRARPLGSSMLSQCVAVSGMGCITLKCGLGEGGLAGAVPGLDMRRRVFLPLPALDRVTLQVPREVFLASRVPAGVLQLLLRGGRDRAATTAA
ncbi:hypothetical protein E2C01_026004 [Portunus trituberculatus]|uniref:Uncharacterized protein n=1 Tax=Portunus trituberculatus TaxID=210409 RepID=A0A5B7EED5_PORTR|nr:hypothetical protein [Portunus trituberculatus]